MGTKSLTIFMDDIDDKPLCVMYRQYDGYPEVHGKELSEFLETSKKIVNGFDKPLRVMYSQYDGDYDNFNGMGCLAAQCIKYFKKGIGDIYIESLDHIKEEFNYFVRYKKGNIHITVEDCDGKQLFKGNSKQFRKWTNDGG